MQYKFYVLDVFTDKKFEGNQLAVFPAAEGINDETMQQIAREFNYSETVFITSANEKKTKNVRIFTPTAEVNFAGHPNIGAAMLLARKGEYYDEKEIDVIFREKVGNVPIRIYFENSEPCKAELSVAKLPQKGDSPSIDKIAKIISLDVSDIDQTLGPLSFSCGLPFLIVQINSLEKIERASLNLEQWKNHLSQTWAPQIFLFTKQTKFPDSSFHARMFAPGLGISEDPATGSAVAALAGYVFESTEKKDGVSTFVVEQGFEIKRPSLIEMSFTSKKSKIDSIRISGNAVIFSEGQITL